MRRRGRKRKAGHRTRSGRLVHDPRLSSAAIAATMPHRHALGEKAVDQLAESELGRLALRGELEPVLATAGADYARHWRGYIASLCAPRALVARWPNSGWKMGADVGNAVSGYCRHFCSGCCLTLGFGVA